MEQFKRAQVVMSPTNEKAYKINQLILTIYGKFKGILRKAPWTDNKGELSNIFQGQHLYIISDDEIKEGDWYYKYITNQILKADSRKLWLDYNCKKIIATTDNSLTYKQGILEYPLGEFNLPQPSQQFIEKYIEEYNKGNIITDVLVEYKGKALYTEQQYFKGYKDILKINSKDNTITIKKLKDSWNREEVKAFYKKVCEKFTNSYTSEDINWFNNNI